MQVPDFRCPPVLVSRPRALLHQARPSHVLQTAPTLPSQAVGSSSSSHLHGSN